MKRFFYPSIDSTNREARRLIQTQNPALPFWVVADFQTHGKGHGLNTWESPAGENLTATLVCQVASLQAADQFLLSQAVSLGVLDFLHLFVEEARIKWPNDLYVGDQKIGGLLIEHDISGASISRSLIGIGININQLSFSNALPNPVSIKKITGYSYDLDALGELLDQQLSLRLASITPDNRIGMEAAYLQHLYRYKQFCPYKSKDQWFEARITGVGPFGELLLELKNGAVRTFGFKEVEFIL